MSDLNEKNTENNAGSGAEKVEKKKKEKKARKNRKSLREMLGTTRMRYGSYSATVTVVVLAIVIVLNLIVSNLPTRFTEIDTSDSSYYSIGDLTRSIVGSLDTDVTVSIMSSQSDAESDEILQIAGEMLKRYQELSDRLQVEYVDPALNPTFGEDSGVEDVSSGSLVVTSEKRSTVVDYSDLYQMDYDYSSYYTTGSYDYELSFDGEAAITSAIDYVTTDTLPILYSLTGHGEGTLPDSVQTQITRLNIEMQELNLLSQGEIPEDADCLLIYCPTVDLSEEEAQMVLDYLEGGGSVLIVPALTGESMPNFDTIYNNYGMSLSNTLVLEGDTGYYYQVPYYLMPTVNSHTITSPILENNISLLLGSCQGITISEDVRDTLTVSSLVTTSDAAYAKALTNGQLSTLEQEEGDAQGPFTVAAAATETVGDTESHLVVIASQELLSETIIEQFSVSNTDLFLNSLSWMCDHESSISISAKSLSTETLTMTAAESRFWMILSMGVIPVALLACGVGVWAWRRRK